MPGKLLQHHISSGATRVRSFLSNAYHGTRKFLQHADVYSSMFRRVLAAAQPALQDMGVQDQANKYAMRAVGAYDQAKSAVVGAHDRGMDHYARVAAAVGQ
jgi:hypothetical protein